MNPLYEAFVQPSAWGKQLHVSRRMEKRSGETLEVNNWSHLKKRKGTEGEKRCLNRVRRPCLFSWRGLKCHTCVCVCVRVFELVHWRPPLCAFVLFCENPFTFLRDPPASPLSFAPLTSPEGEHIFLSVWHTINFDPVQGWVIFAPSLFSLSSPFLSVNPSKMDGISVLPFDFLVHPIDFALVSLRCQVHCWGPRGSAESSVN